MAGGFFLFPGPSSAETFSALHLELVSLFRREPSEHPKLLLIAEGILEALSSHWTPVAEVPGHLVFSA